MAIGERDRHRLYDRLEQVLGSEEATILMAHLPPLGWADVATKRDLDALAEANRRDHEALAETFRRDHEALAEMVEHHDAANRIRQRGDEQAVVPSRDHARDGRGRVAAEAIGHEPLRVEQHLRASVRLRRELDFADYSIEQASWHSSG